MEEKKKNKYPWELLEASTIMIPIELLAYHTFKYKEKNCLTDKQKLEDLEIIGSYLVREKMRELEVGKCFKTK